MIDNVLSASNNRVTGFKKRTQTDYLIFPHHKHNSKPAQRKTELMKYLSDTNNPDFDVSQVFEDAAKALSDGSKMVLL